LEQYTGFPTPGGFVATPPEVVRFHEGLVRVRDEDSLRELLARDELDLGCKPHVRREPDGSYSVPVIATERSLQALRAEGLDVTIRELPEAQRDVGAGDRFEGGRTHPRGYGAKVTDDTPRSPPSAA
jgi:hypothetical protein